MRYLFFIFVLFCAPLAEAGLFEVGYSYSRSESNINDDNFQLIVSNTATVSWYFLEMSAIELSYTKGEGSISAKAETDLEATRYRMEVELYGADIILTFAQKDWMFQPYIKGGAVWIDKKLFRKQTSVSDETLVSETDKNDAVPSAGAGMKFFLTKHVILKASYDTWRSGKSGDEETWDKAIRGGISFIF